MRKFIFIFLFSIILISLATLYFCNRAVDSAAKGKIYSDLETIPYNKVGLLLGTSKYVGGRINLYYAYRIDAAAELLKAGKIKYLIISGDNSVSDYNEPGEMRKDLMNKGIDSSVIYLDYAGFRTWDSIIRLREIFGQHQVTIISQPFHNERAIYIASREGISAIGYNARDVNESSGLKVRIREKFARVKMFLDLLLGKKPKFLGEKIIIPS